MNNYFENDEYLYRAIRPDGVFWHEDGTVSSAAFKAKNGLSVDRGNYREDKEVVEDIQKKLVGRIAKFSVGTCNAKNVMVFYLPTKDNEYHCEIWRDSENRLLSSSQASFLSKNCEIIT